MQMQKERYMVYNALQTRFNDCVHVLFESCCLVRSQTVRSLDAEAVLEDDPGLFNGQASSVGIAEDDKDASND